MPESTIIRLPLLYFPPISWFVAYQEAEQLVLGSQRPYRKQTFRNRCRICSSNGIMTLSVPVKKQALINPFDNVYTDPTRLWQRTHWRAIESAYNRSPFFLFYKDEIEPYFIKEEPGASLMQWNRETLAVILRCLGLNSSKVLSGSKSEVYWKPDINEVEIHDYSGLWLEKKKEVKQDFNAYQQVFSDRMPFEADLSILDLLFNLGPESRVYLDQQSLSLQ